MAHGDNLEEIDRVDKILGFCVGLLVFFAILCAIIYLYSDLSQWIFDTINPPKE